MAYGGGTFISQNKELPGAYMNFFSAASASATLSDRGVAAMPLELDWGVDDEIFTVTSEDFQKNSMKLFGYAYSAEQMKGLRDLFKHASKLYAYKLNSSGTKATCDLATALYGGVRGNDLEIVVETNVDDTSMFDVTTYLGDSKVDEQTVESAADLVDNDYLKFNKEAELTLTAGTPLTGGDNGTVSGDAYQNFINKAEAYSFNVVGVVGVDDGTKALFDAWVKRMRDEVGVKFQFVGYNYTTPDYMGSISVKNAVKDEGWDPSSLVYWVVGAEAGCAVNRSCENMIYDGEFDVDTNYTQADLKEAIKKGEFVLHRVGDDVRVLEDINTMVTTTDDCGDVFKDNQTIRVIDQIANDIATVFVEKYLGFVPNDAAGRISLWSDIVKVHQDLQDLRAIEDFNDSDITVAQGEKKKSVAVNEAITVINAMSQLYMTVMVA